jgi:hypothetical protein
MPVTIVCDGCGKALRPSLYLTGNAASISLADNHVTMGYDRDGAVMISCSETCRAVINAQYEAGAVVDPVTGRLVFESVGSERPN